MSEELEEAILFFTLSKPFTKEDLKNRFRELANKYHPDKGEYTSDTLFVTLLHYKNILEQFLQKENQNIVYDNQPIMHKSAQPDYPFYKEAKKMENEAILNYYRLRKNINIVELDDKKNKELLELREKLFIVKQKYEEFLSKYPESIWIQDVKDSLYNITVWWK
jgi:hypothetical protein